MEKFNQAPLELRLFAIFSVLTTIFFWFTLYFAKELDRIIVPFTGWSPVMPYMFSLYFIFSLIFGFQKTNPTKTKLAIIIMLLIYLIFGIEEIYRKEGRNFDNPYLEVSEYRFIWAVLIPVIWILVFLFSPNIKKFCEKKSIEFD